MPDSDPDLKQLSLAQMALLYIMYLEMTILINDKKYTEEESARQVLINMQNPNISVWLDMFPNAIWNISMVATVGANKYTDHGWLEVPNWESRYRDALLRHIYKETIEGYIDSDYGLPHPAHGCWNALALLEKTIRERNA